MEKDMASQADARLTVRLVLGLVIATLGVLFTLDNLGVLYARDYIRLWPIVFVAIGIAQIAQAKTSARMLGGGIWILLGGVLLGRRAGLLPERIGDYWPLLLVLLGGYVVWQSLNRTGPAPREGDPGPTASAIAIMGGFSRKVTSDFSGAELTAFMGGGKLDLREAKMTGQQAVIHVLSLMGGFELLIPDTWTVRTEVIPFMGGVDDRSAVPTNPSAPTLVLKGFVMMGGVDIRNYDRRNPLDR